MKTNFRRALPPFASLTHDNKKRNTIIIRLNKNHMIFRKIINVANRT